MRVAPERTYKTLEEFIEELRAKPKGQTRNTTIIKVLEDELDRRYLRFSQSDSRELVTKVSDQERSIRQLISMIEALKNQ